MGIGIGIVGLGWISEKIYLPFFLNHMEVQKIAVYDIDPKKRALLVNSPRVIATNTLKDLLNSPDIDAVFIASPNYLHYKHIMESLQSGKIVFCDKPICINAEQVEQLIEAIAHYPNRLFPLLPNRFRQDMLHIKSLLDSNEIGKVYKIKAHWLRDRGIPGSAWFLNKEKSGGGVLVDLGTHMIDLINWLCGPRDILRVAAHKSSVFLKSDRYAAWHNNKEVEDFQANVEDNISIFAQSKYISWFLNLAWAGFVGYDETYFEMHGESGVIIYKGLFGFSSNIKEEISSVSIRTNESSHKTFFDISRRNMPYFSMLAESVEWIKGSKVPSLNVKDALDTISLIDLIYKSSEINDDLEMIRNA